MSNYQILHCIVPHFVDIYPAQEMRYNRCVARVPGYVSILLVSIRLSEQDANIGRKSYAPTLALLPGLPFLPFYGRSQLRHR